MSTAKDNDSALAEGLGQALEDARRTRRTIPPPILAHPRMTIDEAYAVSLNFLKRRLMAGDRVVGKKIGVTSKVVQDMLGVHQPDFGFLLESMMIENGGVVRIAENLIQPRAEAEIAFLLNADLAGPGIEAQDVLAATECVAPCFEIVDSRIDDWRVSIQDTIADNASCGLFVVGEGRADPRALDLGVVEARVFKNSAEISRGVGAAVQGSPLNAVAWLANTLGHHGVPLLAGEWILSGSLVPLEPARAGDTFYMQLDGVGDASVTFT